MFQHLLLLLLLLLPLPPPVMAMARVVVGALVVGGWGMIGMVMMARCRFPFPESTFHKRSKGSTDSIFHRDLRLPSAA